MDCIAFEIVLQGDSGEIRVVPESSESPLANSYAGNSSTIDFLKLRKKYRRLVNARGVRLWLRGSVAVIFRTMPDRCFRCVSPR